ncbi:uncharacterized protein METZ01_LOCUS229742, partial [marine metagenome]
MLLKKAANLFLDGRALKFKILTQFLIKNCY